MLNISKKYSIENIDANPVQASAPLTREELIAASEKDLLGKKTPSVKELSEKYSVTIDIILEKLFKGIKVEFEHTECEVLSSEIARDHLNEDLDYYEKLAIIDKGTDNA